MILSYRKESVMTRDPLRQLAFVGCLLAAWLLCVLAWADAAFEDPRGRFAMDLPKGWTLDPQTDPDVYVFKKNEKSMILEVLPDVTDREVVFARAVATLQGSGLPTAKAEQPPLDLTANGNQARWGQYRDNLTYGSVTVELHALVGGISLDRGGIVFLFIGSKGSVRDMGKTVKNTFLSIRSPGQQVTGVSAEQTAPSGVTSGHETTFTHDRLTLRLPAGWVTQDIPSDSEPQVIGYLKSNAIPGASITVMCYRGWGYNQRKVRIAGLMSLAAAYPKGQQALKKPTKIRTESGSKAVVELWRGVLEASGQTVSLQSPMGIVRTEDCWLLMIGYGPESTGAELERDFEAILKSAR
jgi:hypothetical protein